MYTCLWSFDIGSSFLYCKAASVEHLLHEEASEKCDRAEERDEYLAEGENGTALDEPAEPEVRGANHRVHSSSGGRKSAVRVGRVCGIQRPAAGERGRAGLVSSSGARPANMSPLLQPGARSAWHLQPLWRKRLPMCQVSVCIIISTLYSGTRTLFVFG